MLQLAFIRKNADAVRHAIEVKGSKLDLDALLALDAKVASLKTVLQDLQTERNALSKQFKGATKEQQADLRAQSTAIGDRITATQPELDAAEAELNALLWWVPNIPRADVPVGPDESGNVVIRQVGAVPTFAFAAKDHVQLVTDHGWADFERVAKISGSRSFALKGLLVRVEAAIHQLVWDKMEREGFTLITVPDLVKEHALLATGHFPAGREDVYTMPEDELFLAGTAEVVLTSLHSGEILEESQLPLL